MTSRLKWAILALLIAVLFPSASLAATDWKSGETQFVHRRGLTGSGTALNAMSGVSMSPGVVAVTIDITGTTVYYHIVSPTGNASGTTTETLPDWVCPSELAAGGAGTGGVSMWRLAAQHGTTGFFNTLVIDNRTVKGTDVDQWNNVTNGTTTYYWNGVTIPIQTVLNQLDALTALSPYVRPNTSPAFSTITADKVLSGASLGARNDTATGVSVAGSGSVVITHDLTTSNIYGLHPISGTTVQYVMFQAGAAGGGITVYTADTTNEPMMGLAGSTRKSGTSYWALPPGNPFHSATFMAIRTGATTYWHVQASSSWTAGN